VTSRRRLRVLISTSTFPIHTDDGVPRFIFDLARYLQAHADVTVLAPDGPGARRSEDMEGVDVRRFTYAVPRSSQRLALGQGMWDNLRESWLAKAQIPSFMVAQLRATKRLIRENRIDVVNAHWLVPCGLTAAYAVGRHPSTRLVLHVHAGDVYFLNRLPGGTAIARYVARRCAGVLADGSHVRDSLDALIGWPSDATLRPMGVDLGVFGRDSADQAGGLERSEFDDGFLLFFGRFSEKKGAVYLVRALPRILEVQPGLGLVMIGDGPERHRVEEEVARLDVASAVRFLGRRSHAEIAWYLHHCRVAVVPSIIDRYGETEGMPTVVVEALAAGALVVGTAVDGIPDVLRHAENGWLCREKDPQDLAAKILQALRSRPDSPVGRGAAATAERFGWGSVAEDYVAHLERAVTGAKGE
jgi:glycosyltransferase involved in cell wall biosynthesis